MPYCYEYPRPAVATDIVLIAHQKLETNVLLIKRKNNPYKGMWAFPGGFMDMNEFLIDTARRELYEETGIKINELIFFGIYDDPNRDPRGRTIGIVYYALLNKTIPTQSGDDALQAQWFSIDNLPPLAFDHPKIWQDIQHKILTHI
ncbi:MAG: NUDIX hydrolase [Bacteroidales bacterium]|nr:NUDIX hydrolase [Bacteroidales bacterium]